MLRGSPGTLEALDNVRIRYASGYNVPSIGAPTGVFVLPFGGVLASEGTPSTADVMRVDCESQNLKSTDAADVFQAYSALCLRGIGGRRSVNVCQTTTVSSSNFIYDNDLRNTGPSTSRAVRNTRENPDVGLTSGEATCSRGSHKWTLTKKLRSLEDTRQKSSSFKRVILCKRAINEKALHSPKAKALERLYKAFFLSFLG
ncbi:hypothetical protein Tco_1009608 [Tanacetum coccineum]